MQIIKQENIDTCKSKIKLTYNKEEINKVADEIAKDFQKNGSISGFRKGKAPIDAIKQVAKKQILEYAKQQLSQNALNDIMYENKWKPFGDQQILNTKIDFSNFEIEMIVGYMPTFDLTKYKEIDITEPDNLPLKEPTVDRFIKDICMQFATVKQYDENDFVLEGDTVVLNYNSTIDGKEFANSKAEGIMLTIGNGVSIPGFIDNLIGMKLGEKRQFTIHVPEQWENKDIANKDVEFDIELVSATKKIPAEFDDSIIEKIPSKEKLTLDMIKEQIGKQADDFIANARFNAIKGNIADKLIEANPIDIPEWMSVEEAKRIAKVQQFNFETFDDTLKQQLIDNSKKRIKLSFILDKIKDAEIDTALTNEEALAILNANVQKMPPNVVKTLQEGKDLALLQRMLNEIQVEWILKWVVDHAKISTKDETK